MPIASTMELTTLNDSHKEMGYLIKFLQSMLDNPKYAKHKQKIDTVLTSLSDGDYELTRLISDLNN